MNVNQIRLKFKKVRKSTIEMTRQSQIQKGKTMKIDRKLLYLYHFRRWIIRLQRATCLTS